MNYQSRLTLVVLALSACFSTGFTVPTTNAPVSTRLQLVPEQGKQLVAAFEAESASPHHHVLNTADERPIGLVAKSSAFVSRIFSIPGAIMGRHPAAEPALVEFEPTDDVVLYPIVGFQFVKKGQQVLPTTTNVSCRLATRAPDEEVYGWYTTACRLDSIYSDTYCDDPKIITQLSDGGIDS